MFAFGPEYSSPSFQWVAKDIAEEIGKEHDIMYFSEWQENIPAHTIFVIKQMPPLYWLHLQLTRGKKLIYIPIDFFFSRASIIRFKQHLSLFDGIYSHNERLTAELKPVNDKVYFIDHYLKYTLPSQAQYQTSGFLLWVGHLEYIPSLIETLNGMNDNLDIKALTDLENYPHQKSYLKRELKKLNLPWKQQYLTDGKIIISGIIFEQWSESKQQTYLTQCKAAFDTKKDNFRHALKPPTKAQKYVYNGIPFAINSHTYAYEYFAMKGLKIPDIKDLDYFLSEEYFQTIQSFAKKHNQELTKAAVAKSYITWLHTIQYHHKEKASHPFWLLKLRSVIHITHYLILKIQERYKESI